MPIEPSICAKQSRSEELKFASWLVNIKVIDVKSVDIPNAVAHSCFIILTPNKRSLEYQTKASPDHGKRPRLK